MSKTIFLDLEGTVIVDWLCDRSLCNIQKVSQFLKEQGVSEVRLFSFAVANEEDKIEFQNEIRPALETALGVKIIDCPSVEDFRKADTKVTGTNWDHEPWEFVLQRRKAGGFRSWIAHNFPKQNVLLLDDDVPNETIINHDTGCVCELVNVKVL